MRGESKMVDAKVLVVDDDPDIMETIWKN